MVPGTQRGEAIVYTHTCHPSLANDNLTGIAAAAVLAREMRQQAPRLTWRFVFGPGTIGSLTWLSRNEELVPRIVGGLVIGLLGDAGPLTYKRSRRGDTATDRIAELVLAAPGAGSRVIDFEPYGYDERQFCSPGFDLPIGRLTRSPNGAYPEYHSSADDLALGAAGRARAIRCEMLARMVRDGRCQPPSAQPEPQGRAAARQARPLRRDGRQRARRVRACAAVGAQPGRRRA